MTEPSRNTEPAGASGGRPLEPEPAYGPHPYAYYYYGEDNGGRQREIPTAPPAPPTTGSAHPGQSRALATSGNVGEAVNDMHRLMIGGGNHRDKGIETFILRQLPTFAGTYNGDLIREWVDKIQILKNIIDAPDADLIRLLPLRMSTRAADFLQGYLSKLPRDQIVTWEAVKKALLTQYGGVPDPTKQVNRLHTAKMGRETPVREFAHEVERLTRLAYPELTSDFGGEEQRDVQRSLLNRISLEQFVSGLPPLLSRTIVERKVEDFQEAVEMAAHLEEVNARFMKKTTINALQYPTPARAPQQYDPTNPQGREYGSGTDFYPGAGPRIDEYYLPRGSYEPHYAPRGGHGQYPRNRSGPRLIRQGGQLVGPRGNYHGYMNKQPMGYRGGQSNGNRGEYYRGYRSDFPSDYPTKTFSAHFRQYQRQDEGQRDYPRHQSGPMKTTYMYPRGRGTTQPRRPPYQTNDQSELLCYRCGNPGHFAKECPLCPTCGDVHAPGYCSKNGYGRPTGRRTN